MAKKQRKKQTNPLWQPWGRLAEVPAAQAPAGEGDAPVLAGQLMWTLPGQEWEHEPPVDERRLAYWGPLA